MEGNKPEQWSIMNIIPFPKSGDLSKGGNYRGISICSLVGKTYNRMILNRIRPVIDPQLRVNQNGFRPSRTTTSQVLALRRLIEGVKDKNLPVLRAQKRHLRNERRRLSAPLKKCRKDCFTKVASSVIIY